MNKKSKRKIMISAIPKLLRVYAGIFFMLLIAFTVNAQETYKLTGVVKSSSDGLPIPGVNVIIAGTTTGGISDIDGKFSIDVIPGNKLIFSFIGYEPQELIIVNQTNVEIALKEEVSDLDEVVVIGYGVQKKKLVTGASIQVDGEELTKKSTTNALQALQGSTPGVTIASTSGQPGSDMKVTVRGLGTIGSSNPLYIVDGVQTDDISYLNNDDIQSIDVLKDAASAAIYGSQAANGVILVTTKSGQGSGGKNNIYFNAFYGVQNVERQVDMLNSKEYATIQNEQNINSGGLPYFTSEEIAAMGEGTNWIDEMLYADAKTQNYSFGMDGSSEKSSYSMALAYTNQEGIVGGPDVSQYERYNFRINSTHKILGDFATIGNHLTFAYVKNNGISVGNQYNNTLRSAFNTSPFLPMYDDDGNYLNNTSGAGVMYNGVEWDPWNEGENNPYAAMMLTNQSDNNNQKLLGDIYAEIHPIEGMTMKSTFGISYYATENRSYTPEYELSVYSYSLTDKASQSFSKGLTWTWDNLISYDKSIGYHKFSAMVGTSAQKYGGTYLSVSNTELTTSDLDHAYIDNTLNTDLANLSYSGGPSDESMLNSYFGRLSYNYREKYLFNGTFRADGSSKFAEGHRWGYFPSVSAGWVVTSESFMEDTHTWLDFLKLRLSWGQVGNQAIDPWQYMSLIDTSVNYYFSSDDFDASGNTTGSYPSTIGTEDLKWETSEQTDFGIDAKLLNMRLGVYFDYYIKTTKDWLIQAPILATYGVSEAPTINGGDVENKGIELAVNWTDKIGELRYSISGNVSRNHNEVTRVPTSDGIVHGDSGLLFDNSEEFYHLAETGHPIGYFWGLKTLGVFQNTSEVENYTKDGEMIMPDAVPGDLIYQDTDGDGEITDDDKFELGDPNPDWSYGFDISLSYHAWDFALSASGVAGNQIVQSYRNQVSQYANYTSEILNRWHGEGTSNRIPRVTNSNVNYSSFSDIFMKDGDYMRINTISLGYDFSKLIHYQNISQFRLYASVLNAFTFTKYNGMDPEIGYGTEDAVSGIDLGYYPRPRTFMVGVNLKF